MDTKLAIESRRAVKHFDPDHKITDAEKDELFRLTMLSPTSFNIQHWRFVVVKDESLRREIRANAWVQAQITDASMLVVICTDVNA